MAIAAARPPGRRRAEPRRRLVLEPAQRSARVERGRQRVGLAEGVVEDLERDGPVVAGARQMAHERAEVEAPLAGEEPVVPAPREHVHREQRRVRQLHEEDLLGRDRLDRLGSVALGEDVEAVEADADARVIRHAHDARRLLVAVDEAPPRERLVGDAHAVLAPRGRPARRSCTAASCSSPLRAVATLLQSSMVSMPRRFMSANFAAARRRFCASRSGPDALEVAERLVEIEREPERLRPRPDGLRRVGRCDEIGLEDLHPVEPRLARGDELLVERSAQADRGHRRAHDTSGRRRRLAPASFP